jgi:DNA polymerase delta subunit 1
MANPQHVYVVEWATQDVEHGEHTQFEIHAFGKTSDGLTVVLRIAFFPYFFVKTPGWSPARQQLFISDCLRNYRAHENYSLPVTRKDAWGYTETEQPFVQLAFETLKFQRIARSRLAKDGMSTFEGTVDPVVRLCHVRNIAPTGWVELTNFRPVTKDRKFPSADVELTGTFTGVGPCDLQKPAPLVLCSWDIEVMSHDGSFPIPEIFDNHVIQIACAFQRLGEAEPYRKVVVCLNETAPIETGEIISVGSEEDVYVEWLRVLREEKVDVMMGWNTW